MAVTATLALESGGDEGKLKCYQLAVPTEIQPLLLNKHFQVALSFWLIHRVLKKIILTTCQFIAFNGEANFQRLLLCHFP